jgi:transcriptional regulator with XRE-family HTH domain
VRLLIRKMGREVPEHGSPKIGRRRLATELRRLRERAGLTGDEVADQLGWSGSKISRIELNRTEVKSADLTRLLDLYGVGGMQRSDLMALAMARRTRGWWESYSDVIQPDYASYIELEAEAEVAHCWSTQLVHGLLQTEGYARAVMESHDRWLPITPPGTIRRLVEVRLTRQRRVTGDCSLALTVVLDESALLRRMGDAAVMREQLDYLQEVSRLSNVTIRVLPLAGDHPIGTGSFILLVFPSLQGIDPGTDIVYLEQLTRNEVYVDEETEAFAYRRAFDQLVADSLDPERSRELIARVADEVWSRPR